MLKHITTYSLTGDNDQKEENFEDAVVDGDYFHIYRYRKKIENILRTTEDPINAINEKYLNEDYYNGSILNAAIPMIDFIENGEMKPEYIEDAKEFISDTDSLLGGGLGTYYGELCVPLYINSKAFRTSENLWAISTIFATPVLLHLPGAFSFKKQIDQYLELLSTKYIKLNFLLYLKRKVYNSRVTLENRINSLNREYWKNYIRELEKSLFRCNEIGFIVNAYLQPLIPLPKAKLLGGIKKKLPYWNKPTSKQDSLFNQLKKEKLLDTNTTAQEFSNIFTGQKLMVIKKPLKWVDTARSKKPNQQSLLALFQILAHNGFIDSDFAQGKVLYPFLRKCFIRADDQTPKNLPTSYSEIRTSSESYQRLLKIVRELK